MARILLVTDDEDMARVFAKFLLQRGYEAVLARDEISAMASLQSESIQLVVLDPLWDGVVSPVDLANALHGFNPSLPMIVLDMRDERYSHLLPASNISFISQPFDVEEIVLRIHRALKP